MKKSKFALILALTVAMSGAWAKLQVLLEVLVEDRIELLRLGLCTAGNGWRGGGTCACCPSSCASAGTCSEKVTTTGRLTLGPV